MSHGYASDHFILCTAQQVLECQCGERLILLGREEDWYAEGRTAFACVGCGRSVTLVEHLDEVQPPVLVEDRNKGSESISDLMGSLKTTFGRG